MATLNFNLNKKDSGNYAIRVIVSDPGFKSRIKKSIGITIPSSKSWDNNLQRVKNHKDAATINKKLSTIRQAFDDYVSDRIRFSLPVEAVDIINIITEKTPNARNSAKYLTDLYLEFMQSLKLTHDPATIKKYEVMYNQLLEFELEEERGGRKIVLPEVDWDFYNDLARYLINNENNNNKTILRKLKNIRTVMGYAVEKKKYIRTYDWKAQLELKDVDPYKVPLTIEEIKAFLKYETDNKTDRMVIDAFITGLFTGLRYSDLQQLSDQHFHRHNDMIYINLSTEKVMSRESIPVPEFLEEILKPYRKEHGRLFTLGENSLSNKLLKKIAKDLKLERRIEKITMQGPEQKREVIELHKAISFHFARYTYIYILDTGGLQATYIQLNVGHKDFKTTQGYLKSDTIRRMQETQEALSRGMK